MTIQTNIREEMKEAMKAKDAVRLSVLRGLLSAFTNDLVAKGHKPDEEISDEDALTVISRQVKQRKDSIEQFAKGGRSDLVESETAELRVLEGYLPAQMSREEIETFVKAKQTELGITNVAQKNQLMGQVQRELKGKADGVVVKEVVDSLF